MDPGVPVFGDKGCSIHVQEVLRSFLKISDEISLFTVNLGKRFIEDLDGIKIHKIADLPKGDTENRELKAISTNIDLRMELEKYGKFDLVYERYSLWSHSAIDYAKQNNIPSVLEINAPLIDEEKEHRKLINENTALNIAKRNFNNSPVLTVVSEPIKEYVRNFLHTDKKIYVVPNGVNTDKFKNNQKPNLDYIGDKFVIGFVGSLKKWHGVSMLIDAFELFLKDNPESILLIIGDSKERKTLTQQINKKELSNSVILTGSVEHSQIPGYLSVINIAVAPYLDQDNFYFSPLKIYEYMAAGLTVLASDLKQIKTIINDLENGKLFSTGDVNSLYENLQWLKDNPDLCEKLGTEGAKSVENNSWDAITKKVIDIIANLN